MLAALPKPLTARRLQQYGPNRIERRQQASHLRELARQFTHPLALLLWMVIAVLFFKWHSAEEQNDREARHWRELERELDQGQNSMRWTG